jgi:spore coat polysaccharide biosynthesis protein SpsF (cytidylyltransferase family)
MKIVAIVQARMGSWRLPQKVLKDLGGATVLDRVLRRLGRARLVDQILVATTLAPQDTVIVDHCERGGACVFRGSEEDVLDRYYRAAEHLQAGVVVRITSDCPLIDPEVTDATIQAFLDHHADYASNVRVRTYPRGLDAEVMTVNALERAWREACQPHQREHVTPYISENPGEFKLRGIENDTDCSRHRWTLDTPEDLEFLQAVYARFGGRDDFGWREVLELVETDPSMADINRHIARKAVHEG